MITNETHLTMLNSPLRKIHARVELHNGSTLAGSFKHSDCLQSFEIDRTGDESKFFGYGIAQKMTLKLLDRSREKNVAEGQALKVFYEVDGSEVSPHPPFYIGSEYTRDENTNDLSIVAYDRIYEAGKHLISEADDSSTFDVHAVETLLSYTIKCANIIGVSDLKFINVSEEAFNLAYEEGANIEGSEKVREILDAIAEATQTIYYIDNEDALVFKRLSADGVDLYITKSKYFKLESKPELTLSSLVCTNNLGDGIVAKSEYVGATQYIRNNPFLELRDDVATLLNAALSVVAGFSLDQYSCTWRGNYLLELGDRIAIITKDNNTLFSYLLNDKLTYNGAVSEESSWNYIDNEAESVKNPSNLGDSLKQTFATVDKVNKEITIQAAKTDEISQEVASLKINTDSINASVEQIETNLNNVLDGVNKEIDEVKKQVELGITAEDLTIEVDKIINEGVHSVKTTTGYKFDDEGLTISKNDSEITTLITEDGMRIAKNDEIVLTANNQGVETINLTARQYLTIGRNSRFEDYQYNRTGCFFIGEGTLWLVEE